MQNEPALLMLEVFLTETLRVKEIGFHQTSVGLSREVVLLSLREVIFVEHLIVQGFSKTLVYPSAESVCSCITLRLTPRLVSSL